MAGTYKVGKKWRADWFDNDGVRHRKRFNTKGEAEAYLTEIKPQLNDDTWIAPEKVPTFSRVADDWIAGRIEQSKTPGAGYRLSTLAQWQSHVAHLKVSIGDFDANEIDAQAIERMIAKLQRPKEKGGRGLSTRTVGKVLTTASRVFRFGMANKKTTGIQFNPVKLIEKTKDDSGEQTEAGDKLNSGLHEVTDKEVLTPQEVKQVILAAEPGFYRSILQTAIYTGARIGELLALRWADVDLDRSVIKIRRTVSTAKVKGDLNPERHRWFDPKTKKGKRAIPIPAELVSTLKLWREKCPKSRLDLVFSNAFGEPANRTGVARHGLKPALAQANIEKNVTVHGLRHTYASMLILLGRPITEISEYLGHADVSITMRVYAHFLKPKKQDTMSDLERLIQNG